MVVVLSLTACRKPDKEPVLTDNGCMNKLSLPVNAHSIDSSDRALVHNLFASNGIPDSNYRYHLYVHDTFETTYTPFTKYDQKTVWVDQYSNGLPVFTNRLVYIFWDDVLYHGTGELAISTSTEVVPKLPLNRLRALFMEDVAQFDAERAYLKDTCLEAEYGYYNVNVDNSKAPVLLDWAWKVTVAGRKYPMAYYWDYGHRIHYDNGIKIFR